ncbi:beta-ketoacyl-ACP synthase II [Anaerovorax odorimutans]|uniref:3-oxoacyl-[acyl-carrier-protein] synthase 2 n=1 Tax=Anaerovorax odorimutans TaxID=109327 RepID=A0ABT1RKY3_9FIRM|nr:beta-ketoacyl-ACP synthase II [Anaerovorax odorimutans]MCQ4635838.1 beta-ketoacyl-ACP synthase II [Anaerovorax odorimutans]
MNEKLVITGMGAVTPIGTGTETYWNNLVQGVCGIDRITRFDPQELAVQIAAEVKDFDPKEYISPKLIREMDLFQQYAYAAADEALNQSGFPVESESDRLGIVMGTAMNGVATTAMTQDELTSGKAKKVSPRFVPKILGNLAAAQFSIAKGIHGPSYTLNTACSSGGDALSMAAMIIRAGEADAMVIMGGESSLCPVVLGSLAQAKALSRHNEDPKAACRPFDADRNGFVMGEGGGALILETETHALARGADILAELAGYANTSDGYHVTSPDPSGKGAVACMRRALDLAEMAPDQIDYINAHGTSTPLGDPIETKAIKEVFGEKVPPVSSTKGATGHLMGAGGITEVIACIKAIQTGILPPTLNYRTLDPECDLDYIPNNARETSIGAAMSNALGFGGQNSSIIVKKYRK